MYTHIAVFLPNPLLYLAVPIWLKTGVFAVLCTCSIKLSILIGCMNLDEIENPRISVLCIERLTKKTDRSMLHFICWWLAPTTDTQWRHKSKKSENLGQCGRKNMLWPYLKICEWELIFGHAVKLISSPVIRSPCLRPISSLEMSS